MNITFVTGNKSKAKEAQRILGIPLKVKYIDLDEIQDIDVKVVTLHKVNQAYQLIKNPVIVDDGGLYIDTWNGFPGTFIKWLISAGNKTPSILLQMMKGEKNRNVTARLVIGFHDGKSPHLFEGIIHGKVASEQRGKNGFDWDRVFIPNGEKKTFAEMTPEEKNKISHRRLALDKLKKFLKKNKYIV